MKQKFSTILLALVFDKNFYEYIDRELHIFFSYCEDFIEDSNADWSDIFDQMAEDDYGMTYINIVYDELENFY